MKVIAVARKNVGTLREITPDDEKDMTLVGYLSFFDAPKQTAGESVTALKRLKGKVSPSRKSYPLKKTTLLIF